MSGVPSGVEVARPLSTGADDPDWALLARVARGDGEAFEPLVERHQDRLVRLCERLLGDAEEARDAAQEVFVKAFRHAGRAEPRGQLFTWLYRIAVNHCRNRYKYLSRRAYHATRSLDDVREREKSEVPLHGEINRPDHVLEGKRLESAIQREIAALDDEHRELIVLRDIQGLSYEEIGKITALPAGTVKSRLHRARLALKDRLEKYL